MDPLQSGLNLMKFLMTGRHRKRSGTEREERETGQEVANHFPPVTELSVRHSSREGRARGQCNRSVVRRDRSGKSFSIPRVRQVAAAITRVRVGEEESFSYSNSTGRGHLAQSNIPFRKVRTYLRLVCGITQSTVIII